MDAKEQTGSTRPETTGPRLWIVLARAYRAMADILEHGIAAEGMCLSDFMVLEVLLHARDGDRGLPISTIGAKVQLANASMTSAIDRLHERGMVVRVPSEADARVRLVQLTEAGRVLITAVYARHKREIEELMEGISTEERTQMRDGLRTMGLRARDIAASRAKERRETARSEAGLRGSRLVEREPQL